MISPDSQFIVADNHVDDALSNDKLELENNEELQIVDNENIDNENDKEENTIDTKDGELTREDMSNKLSIVPYYSLDYTQGEIVIIIGGETEGLSYSSLKIASDNNGFRVNIPLNNGVESLNSGMALGIIAFEIKRQFLMALKKE